MTMYQVMAWIFSVPHENVLPTPIPTQPIVIEQVTQPVQLGEGPHWDPQTNVLYFVDIFEQNMHCYHPESRRITRAHLSGGPVTVIVPIAGKRNTFIVGCGTSLLEVYWDPNYDNFNPVTRQIAAVDIGRDHTRFNDGKVDPRGRFWAGTMGQIKDGQLLDNRGSLYRFNFDGRPSEVLYPVSISNGLVWNLDNDTFYYADSPTLKVEAFDYNQVSGDISNRRSIFNLPENDIPGIPDGITMDTTGNLWVAISDGGRVIEVDPRSGKLLRTIKFPVSKVNSVAFGGIKLDVLYVATARHGLTEKQLQDQPLAGAVFAVYDLGVKGTPMLAYKMI